MIIVEDGTNVPSANSYVSLTDANAYHTLYGNSDWTGTDADKELAIINACKSMEMLYGPKYKSAPLTDTQSLLFPRYAFYDNTMRLVNQSTIPQSLKDAQCEIALLYLQGINIYPDVSSVNCVVSESVTVGEISTSTQYNKPVQTSQYEGFRKVDLAISAIIAKRATSITLRL